MQLSNIQHRFEHLTWLFTEVDFIQNIHLLFSLSLFHHVLYISHISQNPLSSIVQYKLCRHSSLFYHFRVFLLYCSSQCETNIKKISLTKKFPRLLLRAQRTPKVNVSQITKTGRGCIIRHLQYLQYRE